MRFQKRYERKFRRHRWRNTIRSALFVLVLCSVTYGWVAHIKNSGSFIPWKSNSGTDHPALLRGRTLSRETEPEGLWRNPQNTTWKQCIRPTDEYKESPLPESTGVLQVFLDGGLNQQRISICNAVAVARILNATLLIPHFQINPVWLDASKFEEIYDIDFFIHSLRHDIRIIRELPPELSWSTREFYATGVHENRVKFAPLHATPDWYLRNVAPKLAMYKIVVISPFTHRLTFDGLPPDIQRLRCRVNFHSLRFVKSVRDMGKKLVARLRDPNHRHIARGALFTHGGDMASYGLPPGHAHKWDVDRFAARAQEGGAGTSGGSSSSSSSSSGGDSDKDVESLIREHMALRTEEGTGQMGQGLQRTLQSLDTRKMRVERDLSQVGTRHLLRAEEGEELAGLVRDDLTLAAARRHLMGEEASEEEEEIIREGSGSTEGEGDGEEEEDGEELTWSERKELLADQAPPVFLPGEDSRANCSAAAVPRRAFPWLSATPPPTGRSKFVALHLRFDMDMVAHSACDYGESWEEREVLARYREYAWLGRVHKLRFSAAELRAAGKCPLTPEEVGLVLAALGFNSRTRLFVATYQVYGGEKRISPLRRLFPLLEDKTSLASEEELKPFLGKASLLAALDFYVSLHSDVFVSASLGNMHNVMAGQRAFFGGLQTVNLNGTLIAKLLQQPRLRWRDFVAAVRSGHKSRLGRIKTRKKGQSLYTYPAPDCLCSSPDAMAPGQEEEHSEEDREHVEN